MAKAATVLHDFQTDISARVVLDTLPDAVLLVRHGLLVADCNPAAQAFFGVARLKGRRLDDIVPGTSPLCMIVQKALKTGQSLSDPHFMLRLTQGEEKKAALQLIPMAEGSVLIILKEEGLPERLDREYKHRRAVRSFQMMASMLAHEIKNPLSGIKGAARLLASTAATSDDKSLATLIENEAARIHRLTDKVAFFAEHAPPVLQKVNMHEILDEVRGMAAAGFASKARIDIGYDPSLPEVVGDRDQLTQVFLNLLKNAAEALPENAGLIRIRTFYNRGPHLGAVSRARLSFGVTIEDNGCGIPDSIKAHMFEPFHTTKANGTGIGLSLAAKIIDDHDGVIEVESTPGRTVFSVFLPFYDGGRA